MRRSLLLAAGLTLLSGNAMGQDRIEIASEWGTVTAELIDNVATRALVRSLPVTLQMRDHLGQEKTGALPASLPEAPRSQEFAAGTSGLWRTNDFVIYYRGGRVPQPGIVVLGRVAGDVSIFDRPGPVTIQVRQTQ